MRTAVEPFDLASSHAVRREVVRAWLGRWTRWLPAAVSARIIRRIPSLAVHSAAPPWKIGARRVLLVSHDLSPSGAPRVVAELVKTLVSRGYGVTVVSPTDGPVRQLCVAAGADVVIDQFALEPSSLVRRMARRVDAVVCNTVQTDRVVQTLGRSLPCFWYIHENSLLTDRLAREESLKQAFRWPAAVWTGSEISAQVIRRLRADVAVIPYGLDPLTAPAATAAVERRLRIVLPGSIESRKGQDLAVEAVALLSPAEREQIELKIFGRVLEPEFASRMIDEIETMPEISYGGDVDLEAYRAAISSADAVLIPSRDDTLPLVSLDALSAGRVLLCTPTTGTSFYIDHARSGFVAAEPTAAAVADMLRHAIGERDSWPAIAQAGNEVFNRNFSRANFIRQICGPIDEAVRGVGAAQGFWDRDVAAKPFADSDTGKPRSGQGVTASRPVFWGL